jgi:hypothetical protein
VFDLHPRSGNRRRAGCDYRTDRAGDIHGAMAMSINMNANQANVLEKIEKAMRIVSALCIPRHVQGHIDWTMSIPADPNRDPDLIIGAALRSAKEEIARLTLWVNDLQSGMYINCVYCGHRYGPQDQVPATMADALKAHIEVCPKHPMSALRAERDALLRSQRSVREFLTQASIDAKAFLE